MDQTPPSESPPRWHTREDSGLRLDRLGRWWHDDEPVAHPKVVEAFNRGLRPTEDGRYRLEFGKDWCFVTVEDAAYRVLALESPHAGGLWLVLSDRSSEPLDPSTLALDAEGIVLCRVKGGLALARFSREAQAALGERLEARGEGLVLRVGEARVPVSLACPPDEATNAPLPAQS